MRRNLRRGIRLKGIKKSGRFPSGNPRCYYRGDEGLIPLPDCPMDDPTFLTAYAAARQGQRTDKPGPQHRTGTIGAGIRAFLASDAFMARATSTRATWRRMAEDIEARYAKGKLDDLRPKHIRADLARLKPHPANNRLKLWRALGRWWVDAGLLDTDPARDVRRRDTDHSDGHAPWTAEDVARFRAYWPVDTMQRLAFEVMAQTGASIGDAVRLGPGNLDGDGWLTYRRAKSRTICTIPVFAHPAPPFYPSSDDLRAALDRAPRHMTWISTARGSSRSHKAAAQWFSAAARKAGIEGKSAHGVRKYLATYMAEHGATEAQRMAILGHDTSSQTRDYSRTADARRIISGTDFGKSVEPFAKRGEKSS
jgi:integrase